MPYGIHKFKRYAINVWNVKIDGKTDREIASEGLERMKQYMKDLGLIMNVKELGVTEDMLEGIAEGTFLLDGGYKRLTKQDVIRILKESMSVQ